MSWATRAWAALIGKDEGRVVSIVKPEDWNVADNPSGEVTDSTSVMSLAAVWACVNLLAGTIASLPLMPYRTLPGGSREVARDHPLYRVLHDSPNSLQTSLDFWEFMGASLELWGNAYARMIRSGGQVVGLIPIMPNLPSVTRLPYGRLRYRWSYDGETFDLTDSDVLHIRGFGGNPLGGMSALAFGARTFGTALATERAAGTTFANGLRPSGILSTKDTLNRDQRNDAERLLQEKFAGAINAGRPMVLDRGVEWKALTINPEDAQMLESRKFSGEEICRLFGVPPAMAGYGDKASNWGTGKEVDVLGFQKFGLRRRCKRIEQALEKQLLTPADRASGIVIEFNMEGILRADSGGRASFYQSALMNGWMTINEVRALENMPPVEGGELPRMQSQNIPITAVPVAGQPPALAE